MLSIGTKKYRNLQEQVAYNTECIKKLDEYLDGITIEDKLVVIESDSGTFTDEELVILSGPLAFISNGSRVWMKDSETLVQFVYKAIDIKATEVGSAYFEIGGSKIVVNRETGAYNTSSDTIITTYSKTQIDALIANYYTKAEVDDALALKANAAGQAFTGAITAPSIIENMSGYSWVTNSGIPSGVSVLYAGAVKNGNKLTLALFLSVELTEAVSGGKNLGSFYIPSSVMSKLVPFDWGGTKYLDVKNVAFSKDATSNITTLCRVVKGTYDISFNLIMSNFATSGIYYGRIEATYLLSDNLAS